MPAPAYWPVNLFFWLLFLAFWKNQMTFLYFRYDFPVPFKQNGYSRDRNGKKNKTKNKKQKKCGGLVCVWNNVSYVSYGEGNLLNL